MPIRLLPADRSKPVPAGQVRSLGDAWQWDTFGRVADLPRVLVGVRLGRVAGLSRGRPYQQSRAGFTALDIAGRDISDARGAAVVGSVLCGLLSLSWCGFGLIRDRLRVVGSVEGGRAVSSGVNPRIPGVMGVWPGACMGISIELSCWSSRGGGGRDPAGRTPLGPLRASLTNSLSRQHQQA